MQRQQQITLTFKICPTEIRVRGNYVEENSRECGEEKGSGKWAQQAAVHYARAKKNKKKYTPMKICKHWRNTFPLFFEAEFNE